MLHTTVWSGPGNRYKTYENMGIMYKHVHDRQRTYFYLPPPGSWSLLPTIDRYEDVPWTMGQVRGIPTMDHGQTVETESTTLLNNKTYNMCMTRYNMCMTQDSRGHICETFGFSSIIAWL